ncbi:hypothetical protein ACQKOE_07410 [Novosphingobium sp. NPDC080210]|uniref:hypothetical protein n=1 Tax=Novosphingobium sp. NPDC080210 TaxID=3390596 RepID=UPI003D041013
MTSEIHLTPTGHAKDCGWHVDQYPWECTCGFIPRKKAMDNLIAQDAVLVDLAAPDRLLEWLPTDGQSWGQHERDVSEVLGILDAIAERASARAEQDAELAKFKALAETLAHTLRQMRSYGCPVCNGDCGSANPPVISCPMSQCDEVLRQYKGARDAN